MNLRAQRAQHRATSITHGIGFQATSINCSCGFAAVAFYTQEELDDMERAPSLVEVAALVDEHIASTP